MLSFSSAPDVALDPLRRLPRRRPFSLLPVAWWRLSPAHSSRLPLELHSRAMAGLWAGGRTHHQQKRRLRRVGSQVCVCGGSIGRRLRSADERWVDARQQIACRFIDAVRITRSRARPRPPPPPRRLCQRAGRDNDRRPGGQPVACIGRGCCQSWATWDRGGGTVVAGRACCPLSL